MKPADRTSKIFRALMAFAGLLLGVGVYALWLVWDHNWHVVEPGMVYRSSRMNTESMSHEIVIHQVASILSLVGTNQEELALARSRGVAYSAYALSDHREATEAQMQAIVAELRRLPKPVLIHCKAGADRTGLVASLYCYAIKGEPPGMADRELSIWYGHLPWWLGFGTSAMDRSFWSYVHHHPNMDKPRLEQ